MGLVCYVNHLSTFFFDKASMVRYIPRITNPRKQRKRTTTTLPPTDIAFFISLRRKFAATDDDDHVFRFLFCL